jgi:hypothetical protein
VCGGDCTCVYTRIWDGILVYRSLSTELKYNPATRGHLATFCVSALQQAAVLTYVSFCTSWDCTPKATAPHRGTRDHVTKRTPPNGFYSILALTWSLYGVHDMNPSTGLVTFVSLSVRVFQLENSRTDFNVMCIMQMEVNPN